MIAPITSQSTGLMRANVTHGVRQVVLAMDNNGKYGMRFRSINKVNVCSLIHLRKAVIINNFQDILQKT